MCEGADVHTAIHELGHWLDVTYLNDDFRETVMAEAPTIDSWRGGATWHQRGSELCAEALSCYLAEQPTCFYESDQSMVGFGVYGRPDTYVYRWQADGWAETALELARATL